MKTKITLSLKMAFIALVCFVPFTLFGATVEIHNATDLKEKLSADLTGSYKLMADITLEDEWTPIGDDKNRFSGEIDGNGKTIYGLKFIDSSRDGAGFIGVSEGAIIKNLSIVGARVYGGQDVGGIVGRMYASTTISECYTSGVFSGYDHIGGIAGGSYASADPDDISEIKNCFSTAAVVSTSWQAGGILGVSVNIDIENTYFKGVAVCPAGRSGGIVALANGVGTYVGSSVVMASYIKGDEANRVMGSENDNLVTLDNNYSWEETKVYVKDKLYEEGVSNAAGVDGEHIATAKLTSASFYTDDLEWSTATWKIEEGTYPVFPYQTYPLNADAIYIAFFPDRALPGNDFVTGAVSALGRTITYNSSSPSVATIDNTGLVKFIAEGTTTLTFSTQGDAYSSGATYTYELKVEPINYEIRTEQDLINIKYDLKGEFTLMDNIYLTKNWEPLGVFTGKLNGNGKVIYDLTINDKENPRRGLFSETENAQITKLGIERANVIGNEDIGAIVGNMKGGLLSECYVANSYISGRDHIGSLVGAMRPYERILVEGNEEEGIKEVKDTLYCTVSNSHSSAQIYSREYQAGGVVGIICGGTIENCYFSGFAQAQDGRAAGIVSLVDSDDKGTIRNNINLAAAVYCTKDTYRIADWSGRGPNDEKYPVSFVNNWSVDESYFGTDLKMSARKDNKNDANDRDGKTLQDDYMARTENFYTSTLGWDFTNTWKFVAGSEGKMYPVLKWQEAPVTCKIYGIPPAPYLTWYPGSMDAIELNKIIASTGQELQYDFPEGEEFIDLAYPLLYVTENTLTQGGITKVKISNADLAESGFVNILNPDFSIRIMISGEEIQISTVAELLSVNDQLFADYKLMNDIDMSGVEFYGFGSLETPFTGKFNGNGHAIKNVRVITGGENTKGLFNATNNKAVIEKLAVMNFAFSGSLTTGSGSADLGGLVGSCKDTKIDQCYVTGNIIGRDHVGGLIGGNCDAVEITNCFVDAYVEAGTQVGGLFGVTAGSVSIVNTYFTGKVKINNSWGWAGGIIGLIDRAGEIQISNTVSQGDIAGPGTIGPHIGQNNNNVGTISVFMKNVENYDVTLDNTNGWSVSEEVGNIKFPQWKSAVEMKQQSEYTSIEWDFNEIWAIDEGVNYPWLKKLPKPEPYPGVSIPTIEGDVNTYILHTSENNVFISGIKDNALVTIFTLSGQMYSQSQVYNNAILPLPAKGLYIVRLTENGITTSVKVINK